MGQPMGCVSPNTLSCIDILMGMKNQKVSLTKKTKRRALVLTENTDGDDDEWRPEISSPLKLAIPLTNTTSFRFCDDNEQEILPQSSSLPSATGEIVTYNSCTSTTSCSSLSSFSQSSIKRSESNDAILPPSKTRHFPVHPPCPPSFTSCLTNSRHESEDIVKPEPTVRSISKRREVGDRVRFHNTSSNTSSGCTSCNCRRSHCLKLYCECFKNRGYCNSECNCLACYNNPRHEEEREETIQQMLNRDPHCFDSHVDKKRGINRSGCRCRKTHCDKKYCECFNSGVRCGDQCQCIDCKNRGAKDHFSS
ncbi:hypothetical protein JH06_1877 [Blastocystis sp. subtype 4]|uniref:hypothetical protein n=1 Tax=Blastocystis sp. subtype 4 TaxID=944170 RepID=UPI000711BC0C|nr:hypothetical protein JH06_1877 [Blastocystis sp. subtype 4]KNB44148.1 hypothetical protein JH06_1877 [Blastocystis sp. subtype 4]|eukprot:XP_014527591.1 hypothetical protein JH06_1877 [Blastocystis sp. subtype 4]